jgi:hypothetical protein
VLRLYIDAKRTEQLLRKLQELQRKDHIQTTSVEDVKLIKEDRTR